jgi:hypothetical protein
MRLFVDKMISESRHAVVCGQDDPPNHLMRLFVDKMIPESRGAVACGQDDPPNHVMRMSVDQNICPESSHICYMPSYGLVQPNSLRYCKAQRDITETTGGKQAVSKGPSYTLKMEDVGSSESPGFSPTMGHHAIDDSTIDL